MKISWVDLQINTNNAKNDVTCTIRLALHQILKTPHRQVRESGSKRFYIWRNIMKAVAFYFRNLEPTQSLHRFVFLFSTFTVDLTFGKILNIWKESRRWITYKAIAHVQRVSFPQMHRWVFFKKCRAKSLEETCNYPDF